MIDMRVRNLVDDISKSLTLKFGVKRLNLKAEKDVLLIKALYEKKTTVTAAYIIAYRVTFVGWLVG